MARLNRERRVLQDHDRGIHRRPVRRDVARLNRERRVLQAVRQRPGAERPDRGKTESREESLAGYRLVAAAVRDRMVARLNRGRRVLQDPAATGYIARGSTRGKTESREESLAGSPRCPSGSGLSPVARLNRERRVLQGRRGPEDRHPRAGGVARLNRERRVLQENEVEQVGIVFAAWQD